MINLPMQFVISLEWRFDECSIEPKIMYPYRQTAMTASSVHAIYRDAILIQDHVYLRVVAENGGILAHNRTN